MNTVEPEDGDNERDIMIFRWDGDDGDGIGKLTVKAWTYGFAGVWGSLVQS